MDAARFFVARAEHSAGTDQVGLRHYLEAAIVFARSITFHVQSEFKGRPGFDEWYMAWQDRLRADPTAKYFLEKRNYVLKVGRVGLRHNVSVSMDAILLVSGQVAVKVIRGRPWYRRSPQILWQDATYPFRVWLGQRRDRRLQRQRELERQKEQARKENASTRSVSFVDAPATAGSAIEHLASYIDTLEILVSEAESRFGMH
jgi:hypothetical protein